MVRGPKPGPGAWSAASAIGLVLVPVLLALAGCGSPYPSTLRIVTPGDSASLFGSEDDSAYPARLMHAATAEGLVAFDPQGRVVPALADRWIVLDDGQSYIFRLRDGTWSDGTPLTAASAQTALRAAIARLRGSAFALDLAVITDIRVMAGRVVEIRLSQPMPDLLQLLAQPELGLSRRGASAGPMQLRRQGDLAELTAFAPERLGLPAIPHWTTRVRTLRLTAIDGAVAVRQFARGGADVMLGGRMQQYPLIASLRVARGAVQVDPVVGLFGLVVTKPRSPDDRAFLASAENREALAMAIDRDALVAAFGVTGWAATTRIVPAVIADPLEATAERWAGTTIAERQARARAIIVRWIAASEPAATAKASVPVPQPSSAPLPPAGPTLRIALPPGPGAELLFARLRADFAAIGVTATRVGMTDRADLMLLDQVARYPRAPWFLNRFNCHVQRGLCDAGTDALMETARRTEDAPTRQRLLAEAEASLTAANVFLPIAAPLRFALIGGDISGSGGFATNPIGWHPLMPMALKPR